MQPGDRPLAPMAPATGLTAVLRWLAIVRPPLSSEVGNFLLVGGFGYAVDVVTFNVLRTYGMFATADPTLARTVAVLLATGVTYLGNRTLTWRQARGGQRGREVALFLIFNLIGFATSVAALAISHDVMGLTSRMADNISSNVVGVGLGTVFRFVTYKYVVFRHGDPLRPVDRDRRVQSPTLSGGA